LLQNLASGRKRLPQRIQALFSGGFAGLIAGGDMDMIGRPQLAQNFALVRKSLPQCGQVLDIPVAIGGG